MACGGSGSPATPGPTAPPATIVPFVSPRPDQLAGQLCAAFSEELATAALGEQVDSPESGEVVPRPNGIYCHYTATADANHNVEAQLKDMTRAEFDALAERLKMEEELPNLGEAAYKLDRSMMGGPGAVVLAFAGSRGVTVVINAERDQAAMLTAAADIAQAVLANA